MLIIRNYKPLLLITLAFDLSTLELVRNVSRVTDNLPASFTASATTLCRVMGKHASNGRRDVTTLTFDL